ncbi:MAG: murein biosynthesis integral membrane protein MurJ [Betaproteobacteria bacterium]|nr:MAG: murein biosynthesis integral membrane protein MurJ [Betaproteobacteria bacterium]
MNLLKALATVSSMTLLSRILGFVRDAVIARVFGAGAVTDAFFVAFKIPNLLRRLFAEGAFSQAFVPVLAQFKNQRGDQATRCLIDHVATLLFLALAAVTVAGILAAPAIIYLTAPGFAADPAKRALTIDLLRIVFPYILFISMTSFAGGILNTYSRFMVPAFTPVLLNLSFIVFGLALAPYFSPPIEALAWAVFCGGVAQLAFQLPFLARLGVRPRFRLDLRDEGVWRILRLMAPAAFGVSIAQVSLLINVVFASFLVTGSVSWLYYADRLMEFPSGMLGAALGTILLPSLARAHANASIEEYARLLDWGLRLTLLLALPAAVALAVLAVPLIATLFMHGEFQAHDVLMTRNAVVAYSVGLVGIILVKILAPGFYARQDIRTPVKFAVITLAVTQLMNLAFIWPLKHAGLALAIGLGGCINAGLLYRGLRRAGIYRPEPGWSSFALRLLVAIGAMSLLLWLSAERTQWWLDAPATARVLRLAGIVTLGAAGYFLTLWLLGFRIRDFMRRAAE